MLLKQIKHLLILSTVAVTVLLVTAQHVSGMNVIYAAIASVVISHLVLFFLFKRFFTKGSLKSTEQGAELTKYKHEQQAILQTIVDALIIIDERGKITQINPSCSRLLGYSEDELIDKNVSMLMADNLAKHHDQYIQNYLNTGDAKIIGIGREVKARHKDGHSLPVHLAISKYKDGRECKFVGVLRDISKEVSLRDKLVKEATHDQLTGLSTRRKLEEFVNMLISSSHRSNRLFAILFIDLNNFKPINDLHGHAAGDAVLKSIAKRIIALTRQEDLCARIGGDEFVVVISELKNNSKLKFIISRYASELSKNIAYEDYSISISASIGSSTFPADGQDYTSLIQHADRAMYKEKSRDANSRSELSHAHKLNEDDKTTKQLYSLTYISESLVPKEGILDVLNQIKEKSEINNSKQHITGKLLLKGEHFLQRLEGEKGHLEKCFERVKKDNRHQNIQLLYFDKITERYFKDWSQMPIVTLNGISDTFDQLVSDVQSQDIQVIDDQSIIYVFDAVTSLHEDKSPHMT